MLSIRPFRVNCFSVLLLGDFKNQGAVVDEAKIQTGHEPQSRLNYLETVGKAEPNEAGVGFWISVDITALIIVQAI